MANATITFVDVIKLNRQLSSKVRGVLAKLLRITLDGDELFKHYKDLKEDKKDLASKVDDVMIEKDELAKKVANLEARLKKLESRLE